MVDMNIGRCECPVGVDGSPCFHQYLLWSRQLATNLNFVPIFDENTRQKFAVIAIGKSLNSKFYQPLHTSSFKSSGDCLDFEAPKTEVNSKTETEVNTIINNTGTIEILEEFDNATSFLRQKIGCGNNGLETGIVKFSRRIHRLSENQLISALNTFGSNFLSKSRRKIKVQPGSVSRRRSKIGSRTKQDSRGSRSSLSLPTRQISTKRKHCISDVINANQPSAKKAGRSMTSITRHFKSKGKNKNNQN